jgi:hypothetical protein
VYNLLFVSSKIHHAFTVVCVGLLFIALSEVCFWIQNCEEQFETTCILEWNTALHSCLNYRNKLAVQSCVVLRILQSGTDG